MRWPPLVLQTNRSLWLLVLHSSQGLHCLLGAARCMVFPSNLGQQSRQSALLSLLEASVRMFVAPHSTISCTLGLRYLLFGASLPSLKVDIEASHRSTTST